MKPTFTLIIFLICSLSLFSQTPEKISYQAVIRNSDNTLVSNTPITLKIRILQNNINGNAIYVEDHNPTTNTNGLVSVKIGEGTVDSGNFSSIDWSQGDYFVETSVDIDGGGSNFNLVGTSQLLSVPYALHAKTSEHAKIADTATVAESLLNPPVIPDPVPYRAEIIPLTSSRNVSSTDINNTIACTTSAILTLTVNFSEMKVGDTINLEAHNGAILTIVASSDVSLNYTTASNATFNSESGNVRFGLLRKSGTNAYIISGQ